VDVVRIVLFAFGYPTAIIVIARFVPVVRERRIRWLVVHDLAVVAIVVGWATAGNLRAVVINSSWLVVASIWYVWGGRRRSTPP
jgi:hypothetical protein